MISNRFQAVSRLSVIKITIKTYMDTYIFLHYPGEVTAGTGPMLRDPASWLALAVGASSRNLGPTFFTKRNNA